MANLKEIRSRITTVKNTRKITSAMSRIAAARLRKAQQAMEAARPYGRRMAQLTVEVLREVSEAKLSHPLLERESEDAMVRRVGIVLITADRGLCGGFNANASRSADRLAREQRDSGKRVDILPVGKKSVGYFRSRNQKIEKPFPAPSHEGIAELGRKLADEVTKRFLGSGEEKWDEVYLVFNQFKNVITQEIICQRLLPFRSPSANVQETALNRIFEPNLSVALDHMLPLALQTAILQALFDSAAAEIAARRQAMDSATGNATDLVAELTLEYNRERQAAITKELMEIIGGAEALKG